MKNINLVDAKLLKVLACKTNNTSHNKNIKFCWEEEDTLLYYEKVNEGWLFSTRKSSNPTVPVRKGSCGKNNFFTYINIKNIISHEGHVAVYLLKKGVYLVKPTTSEQKILQKSIQKRMEGDIIDQAGSYYIQLNKSRHQYIFGKNKCAKVHIVNNGLNAYMEIEPASKEDIKKYPTLVNVQTPFGNWKTLGLVSEYTYIQPQSVSTTHKKDILCPVSFMRVNNREKEPFMVWQRDNGAVILEPHPLKCDVCGGKISRFKDKSIKGYTCNSCHKILPKIRQLVTNEDFNSTLNSIRSVQSLLESMK